MEQPEERTEKCVYVTLVSADSHTLDPFGFPHSTCDSDPLGFHNDFIYSSSYVISGVLHAKHCVEDTGFVRFNNQFTVATGLVKMTLSSAPLFNQRYAKKKPKKRKFISIEQLHT